LVELLPFALLVMYLTDKETILQQLATGNWEDLATHLKSLKLIIQLRKGLSATGFQGFLGYLMAR
jgi:hypothetical protein